MADAVVFQFKGGADCLTATTNPLIIGHTQCGFIRRFGDVFYPLLALMGFYARNHIALSEKPQRRLCSSLLKLSRKGLKRQPNSLRVVGNLMKPCNGCGVDDDDISGVIYRIRIRKSLWILHSLRESLGQASAKATLTWVVSSTSSSRSQLRQGTSEKTRSRTLPVFPECLDQDPRNKNP